MESPARHRTEPDSVSRRRGRPPKQLRELGDVGLAAPEDVHTPEDDHLEDGPSDQGQDGADVEDGACALDNVGLKNAVERGNEDVADVVDGGH